MGAISDSDTLALIRLQHLVLGNCEPAQMAICIFFSDLQISIVLVSVASDWAYLQIIYEFTVSEFFV